MFMVLGQVFRVFGVQGVHGFLVFKCVFRVFRWSWCPAWFPWFFVGFSWCSTGFSWNLSRVFKIWTSHGVHFCVPCVQFGVSLMFGGV